jgi:alkanesulfonate monooxygenase SsuD/methylene tetrahydromethanopterin reductase-like flavin-dependent oxidoreductase (luciferase family)
VSDYGRELEFGVSVEPLADPPVLAARVAKAADRAGLDLVGIQDHPYQRRFLDTWTLISTLVPVTEHVRFFPDVVNLPLRPPAMLAKAAASLDVLSGGRVEIGLGAGAFWDAVVGMGGPRRSPGEAVRSAEEAIGVMRYFRLLALQGPGAAGRGLRQRGSARRKGGRTVGALLKRNDKLLPGGVRGRYVA